MLAVERWQGLPPHAGQNLASAPGPASRRRQWCARMTETLESCRLQGVRQILDTISIATLLLAACRPDRRRSLTFEARNMPERVGEEGSRRVPRQVFKVSTPPSHPRTPAGDTTEHGKMGRKLLMLSATPNCSPAEREYIYTEIRPYAAGRRLAAHCRPGRFGSGDDWRCAERLPPIQVPGRTKTGSPKRKGGAQGTEVRQAADKGCGRKARVLVGAEARY